MRGFRVHLNGSATVADVSWRIVCTTHALSQDDFSAEDEVIILSRNLVAARGWRSGHG